MGLRDAFRRFEQNLPNGYNTQPKDANEAARSLWSMLHTYENSKILPGSRRGQEFLSLFANFAAHPVNPEINEATKEKAALLFNKAAHLAPPDTLLQMTKIFSASDLLQDLAESEKQNPTNFGRILPDYEMIYNACEEMMINSIQCPPAERIKILDILDKTILARMVELHEGHRKNPHRIITDTLDGSFSDTQTPTDEALKYLSTSPTWQRLCKRDPELVRERTSERLSSAIIDPTDIPEFFDTSRPKTASQPSFKQQATTGAPTFLKDNSIKGVIKQYWDSAAIPANNQPPKLLLNAFTDVARHPNAKSYITGTRKEGQQHELEQIIAHVSKNIPPEEILDLIDIISRSDAYNLLTEVSTNKRIYLSSLVTLLERAPEQKKYPALAKMESSGISYLATHWEKSGDTVRLYANGLSSLPTPEAIAVLKSSRVWQSIDHQNPRFQEYVHHEDPRLLQALNL